MCGGGEDNLSPVIYFYSLGNQSWYVVPCNLSTASGMLIKYGGVGGGGGGHKENMFECGGARKND